MQPELIESMARTQHRHWWFVARRLIIRRLIRNLRPQPATLLEIGCGPGGNLAMLAESGSVAAMEKDRAALELARKANPGVDIREGGLPDDAPFPGRRFDLVLLLDVLEHIENDHAALLRAGEMVARGGHVLVTAPAYPWLFGAHDRMHHHFRRYTARSLREAALAAGYRVARCGYFNTLLFPMIAAARLLARGIGATGPGGTDLPPRIVNEMLRYVFSLEALIVPHLMFPFGVSVIALLEKD